MTLQNPESVWFGFAPTSPAQKTGQVKAVFESVATRYDLMNDLMSGGLHRLWKRELISRMAPRKGQTILDVAGGTGDISFRLLAASHEQARVILSDINPAMLAEARHRAVDKGFLHNLEFLEASAEKLPLPDDSVDSYVISFGLRNVTHIDTALAEAARVLKPGGRFFCLEFSPAVHPLLARLYDFHSFTLIPWIGELVANDRASYQYLVESIRRHPAPEELARRMEKAGLGLVRFESWTGGIVALHTGWKL